MRYSLSHLTDQALLRDLAALVAQDRNTTASMLAHLAEVDARKLYLPAGYPSLHAWCLGELGLPEDSAARRIRACRAAREFPAIFPAVADGRLHLSAVVMLAPHLTPGNAEDLIVAATHKTSAEIRVVMAERFPQSELMAWVTPAASAAPCQENVCERSEQPALARVTEPPRATVKPLAPGRVAMQVTLPASTGEKLRHAQELLSHAIPSGDIAQVLDRALDALIAQLEKKRCAATSEPRPGRRTKSARHIPAHVRREVWKRDQGRCTFVGDSGHRCESRTRLEFDHALPFARGGEATISNLRLRCRAHNQYEAERAFGERFMNGKRDRAAEAAGKPCKRLPDDAPQVQDADVIPWLRALGFRADEARAAAAGTDSNPGAPLEQRVRVALASLSPGRTLKPAMIASAT
jgi:5-methylcytosine-specific restriction endonuclease McrA